MLANEKSSKNIIFVNLPEETSEVLLSVVFRHGYYDESDNRLGYGHLLEHLIVSQLENDFGRDRVFGTTGDRKIQFDIELGQKNVAENLSSALASIFTVQKFDKELLDREKEKIGSEIAEKSIDFYQWLRTQTIAAMIESPSYLKRDRFAQLNNTREVNFREMQIAHERLTKQPAVIFIGGHKISSALKKELSKIALNYVLQDSVMHAPAETVWQKKRNTKKSYPEMITGAAHISLAFPAPSLADPAMERYALTFINDQLSDRLDEAVGEVGIYSADHEYFSGSQYGFVSFSAFASDSSLKYFQEIFFRELNLLGKDKDLEKNLKKYIARRKGGVKSDWANNYDRMDWVVNDMIDLGSVQDAREVVSELNTLTPTIVRKVIKKVFGPTAMYQLTISPESNKI